MMTACNDSSEDDNNKEESKCSCYKQRHHNVKPIILASRMILSVSGICDRNKDLSWFANGRDGNSLDLSLLPANVMHDGHDNSFWYYKGPAG